MQIVHIVKSLLRNSGVGVFVAELAAAQLRAGHHASIFCRWFPQCAEDAKVDYHIDVKLAQFGLVCRETSDNTVMHVHALWEPYMLKALWICRRSGLPYIVSPHGGLMPRVFTKGRIKKWIFWHCLLKPLVRRAAAIHCTGEAEKVAVQKLLGKRCPPIFVAPLGVHLPESREKPKAEVKTVLFLGRLGEEKGLVKLLDAWNQVKREGWQLVIAGPDWEGYQQVLLDHCRFLNLQYVLSSPQTSNVKPQTSNVKPQTSNIKPQTSNSQPNPIFFTGPVSGDAKDSLYRSADIFVLPSPMENFSHVVIEALAFGVPVIATKGTPWGELESERCGRWINQGVEPLAAALRELMAMSDEERAAMGANGRSLAEEKYQWSKVAETLKFAYQQSAK